MFDKIRKKVAGNDFKFLDSTQAAKEFLTGEFLGSTVESWKEKSFKQKDGISVRVYEGPNRIKAGVVYNPNALEEKYALILDTSGNYDIDKYDPSKFVNETPKEKDPMDLTSIAKGEESLNVSEEEVTQEVEQEQPTQSLPKISKKEEKAIDNAIASHNLGAMNAIVELNEKAEADKQKIIDALENMGATYIVIEDKRKFLAGSEEFGKDVTKQKTGSAMSIKCISSDANLIRMQLGDYISAIYRKV